MKINSIKKIYATPKKYTQPDETTNKIQNNINELYTEN